MLHRCCRCPALRNCLRQLLLGGGRSSYGAGRRHRRHRWLVLAAQPLEFRLLALQLNDQLAAGMRVTDLGEQPLHLLVGAGRRIGGGGGGRRRSDDGAGTGGPQVGEHGRIDERNVVAGITVEGVAQRLGGLLVALLANVADGLAVEQQPGGGELVGEVLDDEKYAYTIANQRLLLIVY